MSLRYSPEKKKRTRLHGIGSLFTGEIINKILGSFRLLIFAPLLGPAGFGALRLAATSTAIISSLTGLGLHTSYLRYLPVIQDRRTSVGFIRKILFFGLVPTVLAALVLILFKGPFAGFLFSDRSYVWLAILVALSLPLMILYKSMLGISSGSGHFKYTAIGEALQNICFLMLGLLMLLIISRSPQLLFGCFLVGMGLSSIWLFCKLPVFRSREPGAENISDLFHRALRYSLWYAVIPLFQYLFDFIDRWMLAHFRDLETTGTYSIIPILAGGMFLIGRTFTPVVARKGAELRARGAMNVTTQLVWGGIALSVLASLVYALILRLLEPAIHYIAGSQWSAALPLLPLFLSYFVLYNIYYLIGAFASFEEKTWVHLLALVLGTVVNISLNLMLIRKYGIWGAAIGTFTGLVTSIAVHVVFLLSRGITITGRLWIMFLVALFPLLPRVIFIPLTLLILVLAYKTKILLTDQDKRMARVWLARTWRSMRSSQA